MPTKKKRKDKDEVIQKLNIVISLLRDLLILNLGQNGVKQLEIQKLVGGDMNRINRLLKNIKLK